MTIAMPFRVVQHGPHQYRVTPGNQWLLKTDDWGWVDERMLPHDDRPWRPFVETVPMRNGQPATLPDGEEFFANSHYLVHRRQFAEDDGEVTGMHLSLRTVENDTRHDWRQLQRIKNELAGPEWEAVELYPAESRVVDTANQYHLWCFLRPVPIGFPAGLRLSQEQVASVGAVQRDGQGEGPAVDPESLAAARAAGARVSL